MKIITIKKVLVTVFVLFLIFVLLMERETSHFQWNDDLHIKDTVLSNQFSAVSSHGLGHDWENTSVYENYYSNSTDHSYLSYIRQTWIKPVKELSTSGTKMLNLTDRINYGKDRSEAGQSTFIQNLLRGQTHGLFVESGAADGEHSSTTLYLETELHWSGLLIEPNLYLYKQLLQKQRNTYSSNVCLNTAGYSQRRRFLEQDTWSRLFTATNGSKPLSTARMCTVQCFPLAALLNSLGMTRIDYLSLDTEGSELEILRTISWKKYHIEIIGVEYRASIGKPEAPFIDFNRTLIKLEALRHYFRNTGMYKEVGILPLGETGSEESEMYGLDVFFRRL